MKWINELEEKGFLLTDVSAEDLEDFIRIENQTHSKYIAEHNLIIPILN